MNKKNIALVIILCLVIQSIVGFTASAEDIAFMLIDLFLKDRVEKIEQTGRFIVEDKYVLASKLLPRFYQQREYQPFWSDDKGPLSRVAGMIKILREAEKVGLTPDQYQLDEIKGVLQQVYSNPSSFKEQLNNIINLDILLTNAYLNFSSDLVTGYIDPRSIELEGYAAENEVNLIKILKESSVDKFEQILQVLLPYQTRYAKMCNALNKYIVIAEKGGWPTLPEGITLQNGDYREEVELLRRRLISTGDLAEDENNFILFDSQLEEAVRRFQYRHGLTVNGIVDKETRSAMNVPVEDRVDQILLNLERLRWLPQNLGNAYLLVNIPDYRLTVVEGEKTKLEMRVIVGRGDRQTPAFASKLTGIVINPYWVVPQQIFLKDILPKLKEDSSYLTKKKIIVFENWRGDAQVLAPDAIEWSNITTDNFKYKLRQEPGPSNSLGQLKFLVPNKYTVYLHDTPARELFNERVRTFSSGCIRVEKPLELAEYLLKDSDKWDYQKIVEVVNSGEQKQIMISELPIYLVYWTSWVDEHGLLHFRNDPYNLDKIIEEVLQSKL